MRIKIIALMLVMLVVDVVCLFADNSNELNGVYISYLKSGGSGVIHNNRSALSKPAVTVYYTIYFEDGKQESNNKFIANGNGSTVSFYIGNRRIKNIVITKVEILANQR
jgi:hypothetical protein